MKILVISNFRSTISVRPEAEIYIGLKKRGVEVDIMTYGDAPYVEKFKAVGIRVIDFHPEKKLDRSEIKKIKDELMAGKHDILQLSNGKAIVNGIQAAKSLPVKIVLYRGYTGNIHWYDPTAYFKYLHPRVDKIFCISRATKKQIQRQLFFDKERPVAIHKGHDLDWYKDIEALPRNRFPKIPADAFWVINVANNRPVKGVPWVIRAMNEIDPTQPIHLLLVGYDMDNELNRKLIRENRNRNKIHLIGHRKDILQLVKTCDTLVLSSIRAEANTKAVIEAMSLQVPPIITDIPGNRDLVVSGESGLVVPTKNAKAIAEAIVELYENPMLYQKLRSGAQTRIQTHFNIQDTIDQVEKMYRD